MVSPDRRCLGALLLLLSLLVAHAAEPPTVPWSWRQGDTVTHGALVVQVDGGTAVTAIAAADGGGVAVAAPLAASGRVLLGDAAPLPFQAGHMYRVTATVRRSPRTHFTLTLATDPTELDLRIPGVDYIVAPTWEDVVAFTIRPPGDAAPSGLLLTLVRDAEADAAAAVGIRHIAVVDLGPLRELPAPRLTASWPELVLTEPRERLSRVIHAGGSGLYRVRFTVQTEQPVRLAVILRQGENPERHWWTCTLLRREVVCPAGDSTVDLLFPVADRRFLHQWLVFERDAEVPGVHLRDIRLEQIAVEPEAAATAGLNTPGQR